MFLKISKLEAVLKKAYKGAGIYIERTENFLIVKTAYMYIEADVKGMTNDFKAAVVRYTGTIPNPGYCMRIMEDLEQESNTIDMALFVKDMSNSAQFQETRFTYDDDVVLQGDNTSVIQVTGKEWAVYSQKDAEKNETEIETCWRQYGQMIVKRSNTMVLAFLIKPADKTLIQIEKKKITII